jgi:hypothetical protein
VIPLRFRRTPCAAVFHFWGLCRMGPVQQPTVGRTSYSASVSSTGAGKFFRPSAALWLPPVTLASAGPALRLSCSAPAMTSRNATIESAIGCASRAEKAIAALESRGYDSPDNSRLRHDLRARLATLRAALDVLQVAPPGSALERDASEIAQRCAAQLDDELQQREGPWNVR